VVRFTGVSPERIGEMRGRMQDADGPPVDAPVKGVQVLVDEDQGTAVVLQFFDSAGDMSAGDQAFAAMDPSDTPGARASVDMCELAMERKL
jgi:hypothetical protein